jgi:hypothetical protein
MIVALDERRDEPARDVIRSAGFRNRTRDGVVPAWCLTPLLSQRVAIALSLELLRELERSSCHAISPREMQEAPRPIHKSTARPTYKRGSSRRKEYRPPNASRDTGIPRGVWTANENLMSPLAPPH